MSHSNTIIAQVMRLVMLDAGQSAVTRADIALLDECARRCTHTTLMAVSQKERHRRIFHALDCSALFLEKTTRRPAGWRREFRLLESFDGEKKGDGEQG